MNYKDYFPLGEYYQPTADKGDLYSKVPAQYKRFNLTTFYGIEFKTPRNDSMPCCFSNPSILFDNEKPHTLERYVDPDAYACIAYSQKIMSNIFLSTLQYREKQNLISHDLCEVMSVFLITSMVGNKFNYLVNYEELDKMTRAEPEFAMRAMTAHLSVARANLNWFYADYCPNLKEYLLDAKSVLQQATLSTALYSDGIEQCETLLNQWKFTRNHIYGNKNTPYWCKNRNDAGLYKKSRADITNRTDPMDLIIYKIQKRKGEKIRFI